MTHSSHDPEWHKLQKSIEDLKKEVHDFPKRYDWIFDPLHNLFYAFLRGVAYSLGLLVAVVIVTPLLVKFLQVLVQGIEWVPLIGDFIDNILQRVQDQSGTIIKQ